MPFDAPGLLGFLGKRTIAGVEAYAVEPGRLRLRPDRRPAPRAGHGRAGLDRTGPAGDHPQRRGGPGRGCRGGRPAVRRRRAGSGHRRPPEPVRAATPAGGGPTRSAGAGHGGRGGDGLPDDDRAADLPGRRRDLRREAGGRVRGAGGPARPGPDPALPLRSRLGGRGPGGAADAPQPGPGPGRPGPGAVGRDAGPDPSVSVAGSAGHRPVDRRLPGHAGLRRPRRAAGH